MAVSEEDRLGRDLLRSWATPLSKITTLMKCTMFFVRQATTRIPNDPDRKPLDTQIHGGRFDGAFGVMLAWKS